MALPEKDGYFFTIQNMSNRIIEKYFDQPNFAEREKEVLGRIVAETGFVPEKEIFRGKIYDAKKVGSLIYAGNYENNPAVLKIQGLRPEVDEIDIMAKFNAQNKSKTVRLPRLYKGKKWNEDDEYGYLLQEEISGKKIYEPPFASPEEIQKLIDCYLYTTYEPCPMCSSAAIWAKMKGIIYGASREDRTDAYPWRVLIPAEEVIKQGTPILELYPEFMREECKKLLTLQI